MARYTIGFETLGIELGEVNSGGYTTCFSCSEDRKQSNRNRKVLRISTESGHYQCNHCGIKGRVDSDEWIEKIHQEQNKPLPTPKHKPKPVQKKQRKPFITAPLNEQGLKYLESRGISRGTAKKLKIAQHKDFIVFNYYEQGRIIGAKYRSIKEKKFYQHADCKKVLYNLDALRNQDEIILTEGEFDAAALVEAGFMNSTSVAQGAPNEGSDVGGKLECLNGSVDVIKTVKRVIIFVDNDKNGKYLQKVLIERFGADRCAVVEIPESLVNPVTGKPCKDANDILVHYGVEQLQELVKKAEDTPIMGIRTVRQVEGQMWDIYNNGYKRATSTGMSALDGHFSFQKGWWNLFHGIPNSGKSEFVLFLMVSMAANHGWKWGCFVPEAYPAEDFYNDCIVKLTGMQIALNNDDRLNKEHYKKAMEFVNEHFYFIYPQDDKDATGKYLSNNFGNVVGKIKELKLSKGIDGFVIDPMNQMSASADISGTKDEKLEQMYGEIDILCKTHNLSGNIVAHPRTLYRDKGEDDYRAPTPYEIAGGAMNYNKAYCIVCIHRPFNQSDKGNTMVFIDVQKVKKHKIVGTPACIPVNYNVSKTWYRSVDTPKGFGALEGAFDKIIGKKATPFTDAINKTRPLDPFGDELPF